MNKRIKRKINKGKFYYYKGVMAWQHHAYQPDRRTKEIMLCYDVGGSETYWKSWKEVKTYMRSRAFLTKKGFQDLSNDFFNHEHLEDETPVLVGGI